MKGNVNWRVWTKRHVKVDGFRFRFRITTLFTVGAYKYANKNQQNTIKTLLIISST